MTEQTQNDEAGFIKYSGAAVPHGVIDAGSAGLALIGLDEALRFFNEQQSSQLATLEYDIPVRTEPGSWQAIVLGGATAVVGAFALSYAKKAGEKLAENDFKDVGLGDILKKSMAALQHFIKLVKHTGKKKGWGLDKVTWRNGGSEIGILNDAGEVMYVPADFFRWYSSLPPTLVTKMTSVVKSKRTLTVGVRTSTGIEVVTVDESEKLLFSEDTVEPDEDILFPEMVHGDRVKLEGKLIRGSEASNSVGLEYEGHVINCVPEVGNVRQFKRALFLKCVVEGTVTRHSKHRFVADKRPTIILSKVTPLERDDQYTLFDN